MSSRRLAVIGTSVGLAAAGVITFLVVKGDPEPEVEREFLRTGEMVKMPAARAAVGPVETPPPPKPSADGVTTPNAEHEKQKAEAAAKADAKRKADDARKREALKQAGAFGSLTGTGDISSGFDDSNIYGGILGNEAGEMQGGFGLGKPNTGGGGGTGWGGMGGIGHGDSGTGSGYGVGGGRGGMRGRNAVPTISIGQPTVVPTIASAADPGSLDKAIIRRYVKRNIQKLQYCYEKQLLASPKLAGTVSTQFTITESGTVGAASANGVDTEVSSCMAGVLRAIQFPKPKGAGGVTVTYPFTVRPSR